MPNRNSYHAQVGLAAFDLRSASLHLSQYIETSNSYQNTKTLLHFYDPIVIIIPPNKSAPNSTAGVTELIDRFNGALKKVILLSLLKGNGLCLEVLNFNEPCGFINDGSLCHAGCIGPWFF